MASKKMALIPDTSLKFSIKNVLAIIKMQISSSQKLYTCTVKRLFPRASGREIHRKNGIPPGITRSLTWKSTRSNCTLVQSKVIPPGLLASGRGIRQKNGIPREFLAHGHGFRPARSKIFRSVTIPESLTLKDLYRIRLIFKN
jgi:hypothetical protein